MGIGLWQFKDVSWMQDDNAQTFKLAHLHGNDCTAKPIAPLAMLIGAKRHKMVYSDLICSQGIYPSEFNYCPYCGGELSVPENRTSFPWIPPYGSGSGLKILPCKLRPDIRWASKGQSFELPSRNGRFSFCSALLGAEKRLLLALQRDIGKLSIYQPDTQEWRDLDGKTGEDELPEWSWSLATDSAETGLAIPGKNGPAWVTIDWATGKLQIDRGEGRSIGGVVRLGRFLLAPVLRGETFVLLCRQDSDTAWFECKQAFHELPLFIPQQHLGTDQPAYFGMPVIDETRMAAYWPCRGGYIKIATAATASEHAWAFRPWETDEYPAKALIELGPPYLKTGARSGLWQLCEDFDPTRRDGLVNKIIKFDGDERIDSETLEYGQFVSTGQASFTWHYDCWNDIHQINSLAGEQKELRYPLLQFGIKGLTLLAKIQPWQGREDTGLFTEIFNDKQVQPVFMRLAIQNANAPEKALHAEGVDGAHDYQGSLFRTTLQQVPELSVFIYDARLYIYFPEDSKCFGWPLEIAEA